MAQQPEISVAFVGLREHPKARASGGGFDRVRAMSRHAGWFTVVGGVAVAVGACSSHSAATKDAPAHVDAAPDALLHAVVITNDGETPTLYEYRDGSGAWQPMPAANSQGESTIEVADDFVVLDVCAGSGGEFVAVSVAATVADGDQYIQCFLGSSPVAMSSYAVTGMMNQPGSLFLSGSGAGSSAGTTSPWTFSLQLPAGTYDALAYDSAKTEMLLRRGLAVTTSGLAVTPAFDLTSEGSAFGTPAYTITGAAASAAMTSDTTLITPTGYFDLGAGSGSSTIVVPTSLLQGSDVESLEISEVSSSTAQYAQMYGFGSGSERLSVPATFAMLAVPSGVTFTPVAGSISAQWTTLPSTTEVELTLFTSTQEQIAIASPAWLALNGTTKLAFDTTAANYEQGWDISTSGDYYAELTVSGNTGEIYYSSTFYQGGGSSLRVRHSARNGGRGPAPPHALRR